MPDIQFYDGIYGSQIMSVDPKHIDEILKERVIKETLQLADSLANNKASTNILK